MSEAAQAEPNCPFYGRHTAITLLGGSSIPRQALHFPPSYGNQCALQMRSCTPCAYALERKPIDWRVCPVWAAATLLDLKGL